MKQILVTGDSCLVQHLRRPEDFKRPQSISRPRVGGAPHLKWILEQCLQDLTDTPVINCYSPIARSQIFAIWGPSGLSKSSTSNERSTTLRIEQVIPGVIEEEKTKYDKDFVGNPDCLVIEDQELGFYGDTSLWPSVLHNDDWEGEVVWKSVARDDMNDVGLQSELFNQLKHKKLASLTVLLSAHKLRNQRGFEIRDHRTFDSLVDTLEATICSREFASIRRASSRIILLFPYRAAAVFEGQRGGDAMEFRSFVYDSRALTTWDGLGVGRTFGSLSLLTGAVVRVLVTGGDSSGLNLAICNSIQAMRKVYENGGGSANPLSGDIADLVENSLASAVSEHIMPVPAKKLSSTSKSDPRYLCCFPSEKDPDASLLVQSIGGWEGYMRPIALKLVKSGVISALPYTPIGQFGDFETLDTDEVESLNNIRRLMIRYRDNDGTSRPLSIGVFGQPGTGKTYAIQQLVDEVFDTRKELLPFDLSQVDDSQELRKFLDLVGDARVQGKFPVVLWDEFDSGAGKWLKDFIYPMQEGQFLSGGNLHPIGKTVWFFAGGVSHTFDQFAQGKAFGWDSSIMRKSNKLPDFVSRLRAYVNIQGVNPVSSNDLNFGGKHLLRRGLLLRRYLEKYHPQLVDEDGSLSIRSEVAEAFLLSSTYSHGARSIEAIVSSCNLDSASRLAQRHLPSPEVLRSHVSEDFNVILRERKDFHSLVVRNLGIALADAYGSKPATSMQSESETQGWNHRSRLLISMLRKSGVQLSLRSNIRGSTDWISLKPCLTNEMQAYWRCLQPFRDFTRIVDEETQRDNWCFSNSDSVAELTVTNLKGNASINCFVSRGR